MEVKTLVKFLNKVELLGYCPLYKVNDLEESPERVLWKIADFQSFDWNILSDLYDPDMSDYSYPVLCTIQYDQLTDNVVVTLSTLEEGE